METKITFDAQYGYAWIKNMGDGDCYVSAYPDIQAESDNVAYLPKGECVMITPVSNSIYVSGTTVLECHAQNIPENPFMSAGGGGEEPVLITKVITANDTYDASDDSADGYSQVTVNVAPNVGTKSITENGTYTASSENLDGYSSVMVAVDLPPALPNTYDRLDYVTANGAAFQTIYAENKGDLFEIITSANALDSGYHTFFSVYNAYSLTYNGDTLTSWQIDTFSGDVSATVDTVYRTIIEIERSHGDRAIGIGGYAAAEWAELFNGRIYSIKCKRTDADGEKSMFNNSNYALYFIPAKRKSDDKVGMYEAVSGVFYPSTTGTEFEAPAGA